MRSLIAIASIVLSIGTASAADPDEFVTAPDAILCLRADSLATAPAAGKSQAALRAMGCLRSEGGIRTRLVRNVSGGAWQVRFYPDGIGRGIVLWGRPSSFLAPDGSRPGRSRGA